MAISNPFYLMAILYFVVDAIALALLAFVTAGWLPAIPALSWLRIHLLTVGVVTQVILGALPGLVAGKVGTTQPGSRTIGATWLLLNVSLVGLLVGMPGGGAVLAAGSAAGVLVAAGLVGFSIYQWGAGPSFGRRADARLYAAAFVFLLFGLLFALSMLLGWPAP
ncbi:MAG: hypothetical protein HY329_17745, partial [Chloroflexi bacterium]|nr:hypothetical protein [Chloroflexota bacterium]